MCVCHHTGAYFHGYSDPGWPVKACLLQTLLCALIIALHVSYPAVGGWGAEKDLDDNAELVGENIGTTICTIESGAQGNKR